jgi:hypothetical protein
VEWCFGELAGEEMVSVFVAFAGTMTADGWLDGGEYREAQFALHKDGVEIVLDAVVREPSWKGVQWDAGQRR